MFPNYCFTKSARHSGYDVIRRGCITRDSYQRSSGRYSASSVKSAARQRSRTRSEIRNSSVSSRKSTKNQRKDTSSKSVGFKLKPVICPSTKDTRESGGDEASKDKMHSSPSNDPNRDLQESFADFFSIIHDNVLESVQEAVERMVSKCFKESLTKMERLSKELQNQEAMLNKIYRDVTSKIAAQSETNLNQFKFVTQMLIDNQTVHYRALNQAKLNKQRRKEERDQDKELKLERESKRKCGCMEKQNERVPQSRSCSKDLSKRSTGGDACVPQHQLCQQQAPLVYHMCQSCTNQETMSRCKRLSRSPSKHTNTPVFQRRSTSYSMPDISGRTSSVSRRFSQPSRKVSKSCLSRTSSHRQIVCLPAMTYPPYVRNCPIPRRKLVRKNGQTNGK
ncbi:uncharacterized protein LOC108113599 [Drosophila eugracilis]|uniref:uncharacterized protein LOC108113599 n=1 Tax=Drosophila eugracilis TaxID=29029 RepID=UPI001BDB0197|nr:uncharacterized protein LOC108113599 [Drosophila eugracilis]